MLLVFVPGENQIAQSLGGIEKTLMKELFERCGQGYGEQVGMAEHPGANNSRELLPLVSLRGQGSGSRCPGKNSFSHIEGAGACVVALW